MKTYSYSRLNKIGILVVPSVFYYLVFPLCSLILILFFLLAILGLVTNKSFEGLPLNLTDTFGLFVASTIAFAVPQINFNTYTNFKTTDQGLEIQSFLFRYQWRRIKWEDIVAISKSIKPSVNFWPVWIVHVKKFDFWHTVLSFYFLAGFKSGFAITAGLEGYEELLETIQNRIQKNQPAPQL